jgi:hypothetical protein
MVRLACVALVPLASRAVCGGEEISSCVPVADA